MSKFRKRNTANNTTKAGYHFETPRSFFPKTTKNLYPSNWSRGASKLPANKVKQSELELTIYYPGLEGMQQPGELVGQGLQQWRAISAPFFSHMTR